MWRKFNSVKYTPLIAFLAILVSVSDSVSALDFLKNFESGKLEMNCSGNCPTVTAKFARSGKYAMESYLNRLTSERSNRTEAVIPGKAQKMAWNRDYWIGFSIYLPGGWEVPGGRGYEILAQIHSSSKGHGGPPFRIDTGSGKWQVKTRATEGPYATWDLNGVQEDVGRWTDWVIHIKPSQTSTGILEVWKDGVFVGKRTGPNTYAGDAVGPYLKLGIYNGWANRQCCYGKSPEKWVYHDELRIASGPDVGYADVAPEKYESAIPDSSRGPDSGSGSISGAESGSAKNSESLTPGPPTICPVESRRAIILRKFVM